MSVEVHYYNIFGDEFLENAMIFCIGTLSIVEGGSTDPLLIIRAHCLIRFRANLSLPLLLLLLLLLYYNANPFSAPGDPSDSNYPDSVPPSINAFLTFVGPITYHHVTAATNRRLFGVSLSVYNKTADEQSTVSAYDLLYIFPETRRWEKFTKTPNIGGYV
jgi:hypothetical protein